MRISFYAQTKNQRENFLTPHFWAYQQQHFLFVSDKCTVHTHIQSRVFECKNMEKKSFWNTKACKIYKRWADKMDLGMLSSIYRLVFPLANCQFILQIAQFFFPISPQQKGVLHGTRRKPVHGCPF